MREFTLSYELYIFPKANKEKELVNSVNDILKSLDLVNNKNVYGKVNVDTTFVDSDCVYIAWEEEPETYDTAYGYEEQETEVEEVEVRDFEKDKSAILKFPAVDEVDGEYPDEESANEDYADYLSDHR